MLTFLPRMGTISILRRNRATKKPQYFTSNRGRSLASIDKTIHKTFFLPCVCDRQTHHHICEEEDIFCQYREETFCPTFLELDGRGKYYFLFLSWQRKVQKQFLRQTRLCICLVKIFPFVCNKVSLATCAAGPFRNSRNSIIEFSSG